MLALRLIVRKSRQASVVCMTRTGKQCGSFQKKKQLFAPPTTRRTCTYKPTPIAGSSLRVVEHHSFARSSIDVMPGKRKHACFWTRSSTLQDSAGAEKLRANAVPRRVELSTKTTAKTPSSNPSTWQTGLRFAQWRAPRLSRKAKGNGVSVGGSKRRYYWVPPQEACSGDKALVYALTAVSFPVKPTSS